MKRTLIISIVLALGLIGFSVYTISAYNKDDSNGTVSKIIVDLLGAIFIIGAIFAIWATGRSLRLRYF